MRTQELHFKIIHSHAAGIDVGSRSHMVAVDQNKDNVREFGVYTKDHLDLISYLRDHAITTIAMESTGTYWQTLFNALQKAGFEVLLVGGNQTKNVKGRKTDVIECIWIQKLHALGLLFGSLLLSDTFQQLRTYYYHREHLVQQSARYSSKVQTCLRLMNVRLDVVLNDESYLCTRTHAATLCPRKADARRRGGLGGENQVKAGKIGSGSLGAKRMDESAAAANNPEEPLGQAIAYSLPRWEALSAYALYGQIEIDERRTVTASPRT